jgi:hypothetical protein
LLDIKFNLVEEDDAGGDDGRFAWFGVETSCGLSWILSEAGGWRGRDRFQWLVNYLLRAEESRKGVQ